MSMIVNYVGEMIQMNLPLIHVCVCVLSFSLMKLIHEHSLLEKNYHFKTNQNSQPNHFIQILAYFINATSHCSFYLDYYGS